MHQDEAFSVGSRWLGLPKRVALGFALALVAVVATAVFSFAALSARTAESVSARRTASYQLVVEEVESALLASDSALDAYLANPDMIRLGRLEGARAKLQPAVEQLAAIEGNGAGEAAIVAHVRPQMEHVRAVQQRVLELSALGEIEKARAMYDGQLAGRAVEGAHDALEDLEHLEAEEVARHDTAHEHLVGMANAVFVVVEALLFALVLLGARLVRDEIRAREKAIAVQRRLVAMVGHDLRSPLFTVIGSAWSLARTDLPDDARRTVRRIRSAGRRMHRLVRDLLDWTRANAGVDIPVSVRETDLVELCARVAEDLDDPGTGRIQIAADGDTRAPVDPDRLEQIVANLLTNALRHGPADRPVRVRIAGGNDDVRIEIRDEGPGIAPEIRSSLFKPFRRAPTSDADAGVGLGLFIVRTLVEAHGGRVGVETAPGQGTTFTVDVPRNAAAPPARDEIARA